MKETYLVRCLSERKKGGYGSKKKGEKGKLGGRGKQARCESRQGNRYGNESSRLAPCEQERAEVGPVIAECSTGGLAAGMQACCSPFSFRLSPF